MDLPVEACVGLDVSLAFCAGVLARFFRGFSGASPSGAFASFMVRACIRSRVVEWGQACFKIQLIVWFFRQHSIFGAVVQRGTFFTFTWFRAIATWRSIHSFIHSHCARWTRAKDYPEVTCRRPVDEPPTVERRSVLAAPLGADAFYPCMRRARLCTTQTRRR